MSVQSLGRHLNPTEEAIILAVETSSRVGSACLARGPELLTESRFTGPMQHSSELFPAIGSLLRAHGYAPTDIDQVHLAIGPGSFTGLRIAVTMAKAMHLANVVRIVAVDSLDVVAANLSETPAGRGDIPREEADTMIPGRIAAVFDAKRGQFYVSAYQRIAAIPSRPRESVDEGLGYRIPGPDNSLWRKIAADSLMTAREIVDAFAGSDPLGLLGDGLLYHRDSFDPQRTAILPERYWSPRAANVYRLGYQKALAGRFTDPLALNPLYLRGPEVTLRKKP